MAKEHLLPNGARRCTGMKVKGGTRFGERVFLMPCQISTVRGRQNIGKDRVHQTLPHLLHDYTRGRPCTVVYVGVREEVMSGQVKQEEE